MAATLAQRSTIDPSAAEAQPERQQSRNFNTSTASAGSNPAEYHSSYSQSQPSGTTHPVTAASPEASETTALQCQVTTPEAISLPEATLHQGPRGATSLCRSC
jgi:hypothetical protein